MRAKLNKKNQNKVNNYYIYKKNILHKILITYCIILVLFSCKKDNKEKLLPINKVLVEENNVKDTINIVAVGDIMIGASYPSKKYLPKDDAINSFSEVSKYLKGDVVFGNLEGVFLDEGESHKCIEKEPNNCYVFRMPERYARIIKEAGFNLLSVANNHTNDFGKMGINRTIHNLEEQGIFFAGYISHPSVIFEIDGIRYGFCAFSPNRNMMSLLEINSAKKLIENLKLNSDIVIVSMHGGAEGIEYDRVLKDYEFFLGENRGNVYKFAHSAIDAGADLVLGHGPHITRAVELYKGKLIAYSLGNFNTYGRFSLIGKKGIAPLLDIKLDRNGNFIHAKVISIKQDKINGLQIDYDQKAFLELRKLSNLDFPDTELDFRKLGEISIKSR